MNDDLFAPKTIERVRKLDNSPRASVCCLLAAAAYHHHIELAVLSSEFSAAHVLDPSIGSAKQLTSAEEMPNLPNAGSLFWARVFFSLKSFKSVSTILRKQ